MAQLAGADAIHMDAADATLVTTPHISFITGILANKHGQRFINEDSYYGVLGTEVVMRQDSEVYLVLDDEIFLETSWLRPSWASDSLADIEKEIGLPEGALEQTIGYYNSHAENGTDPLFHKQARWIKPLRPPYAVIDLRNERARWARSRSAGCARTSRGRCSTCKETLIRRSLLGGPRVVRACGIRRLQRDLAG